MYTTTEVALDPLEMLLDAARYAEGNGGKYRNLEWAKAARAAVAKARQPDGERREAIARILERIINRRVLQDRIDGYTLETSAEMTRALLASGLVQNEAEKNE